MGEFVVQALLLMVGGLMIVGGGSCVLAGAAGQLFFISSAMALLGAWVLWIAIKLSGRGSSPIRHENESNKKSIEKEDE
jgi:hypothetical protein